MASAMIEQLRREPGLLERVTQTEVLELNYRWEQKNGLERAYVELILDEYCIRLANCVLEERKRAVKEREKVRMMLLSTATILKLEMQQVDPIFNPVIRGYYLKGERQEYDLGKI